MNTSSEFLFILLSLTVLIADTKRGLHNVHRDPLMTTIPVNLIVCFGHIAVPTAHTKRIFRTCSYPINDCYFSGPGFPLVFDEFVNSPCMAI